MGDNFKKEMKKIVVLGPESTGKTDLCRALSHHFDSPWIPEYARDYVSKLQQPYTYEDLETIARHQIVELEEALKSNKKSDFLFIDTDLIITKVWFLHVFGRCPDWLQSELEKSEITLYLLCKPDIPWEYDSVRENPEIRDFLYDWYKREIEALGRPYVEISGLGEKRLRNAIVALQNLD